jgi:hypothetical protein
MIATARKTATKQQPAQSTDSPAIADLLAIKAALWAFFGKLAESESSRDDLHDGQHSDVKLAIVAEVDGHRTRHAFTGSVDVGHSSTRASSAGPNQDELLALVLSKLNTVTRDAICRDLASDFAAAGGELPPVDAAIVKQAAKLRADLRQKVEQQVRGTVRVNYAESDQPELAVFGG